MGCRFLFIFITIFIFNSQAEQDVPAGPTPYQEIQIFQHNEKQKQNPLSANPITDPQARPFAEYEQNGYLLLSASYSFDSLEAKHEIAKNLPKDMTLVIYTYYQNSSDKKRILNEFSELLPAERIKVITLPAEGNQFWSRDGLPVPIVYKNSKKLRLVDAKYYHNFEPDQKISEHFNGELMSHSYYYEGGNFMPNRLGDCLVVEKNSLPTDDIFQSYYGCKRIIRLPHIKGIGHADESVKFISDNEILTDAPEYVAPLKKAGFKIQMLPRPSGKYETYVNALNVNGVVYVPIFNEATDAEALQVYASLGHKVVPIFSGKLSNQGAGSIHCITMNYPMVPFQDLLRAFNAQELK